MPFYMYKGGAKVSRDQKIRFCHPINSIRNLHIMTIQLLRISVRVFFCFFVCFFILLIRQCIIACTMSMLRPILYQTL